MCSNVPQNFDPKLYKLYNQDLRFMSDQLATEHYINYGCKENRIYFCGINYDDLINQNSNHVSYNNSILLINHEISKTGAPLFLYDLYHELETQNIYKNIYIVEPYPNKILPNIPNKLYHFNNKQNLYNILTSTYPLLIYSNSLNFYLYHIDDFKYWHKKTILHFHETLQATRIFISHIKSNIASLPTFVVSDKIKQSFIDYGFKNVDTFAPFISDIKQEKIRSLYKHDIRSENLIIDKSKITIGMCGEPCDRKNLLLFIRLAINNPKYNFIWVGGLDLYKNKQNIDPQNLYPLPSNFYWVPSTDNPYQYFKLFDYFFLTSKEDPCPIVVLENLLLNNKIIVIKNNIHTQHQTKLLDNYIELESIGDEDVLQKFSELCLTKQPNIDYKNTEYIQKFYTKPQYITIDDDNEVEKHWLIMSMYMDKYLNDISNINYYINIINQFILRHKNLYNFIPIIVLSSDYHHIYGQKIQQYLLSSIINLKEKNILKKSNYGYDIAGMIDGVKFIFKYYHNTIKPHTYLAYIHNKNNPSWRNILHEIFYENSLSPYDTISAAKFTALRQAHDLNNQIFVDHPDVFDQNVLSSNFQYSQGTTFITKIMFLKELCDKYYQIKQQFTHINKNDVYWQNIMKQQDIFLKYYMDYKDNIMNVPIDWDSHTVIKNSGAKNYLELYQKYGLKGIPDCQFEHALERYLGFLILNNQTQQKIQLL